MTYPSTKKYDVLYPKFNLMKKKVESYAFALGYIKNSIPAQHWNNPSPFKHYFKITTF